MVFVGLNDSFEQLYQAVRRCYRFGQKKEVEVYLISSILEGAVLENIKRKELQAEEMSREMVLQMKDFTTKEVKNLISEKTEYVPALKIILPEFVGTNASH